MNPRRVARLLRDLADEIDPPATVRPKRARLRPEPPAPAAEPTELDRARARRDLARRGFETEG